VGVGVGVWLGVFVGVGVIGTGGKAPKLTKTILFGNEVE
jgi:hypothetical protein